MLGKKLKELRISAGLLQRQVAAELEIDTAYLSKIENSAKPVSISSLPKLASYYNIEESLLNTLWLADKVIDLVKNEDVALKALSIAENELKKLKKEASTK